MKSPWMHFRVKPELPLVAPIADACSSSEQSGPIRERTEFYKLDAE
jgi:hypothetical protein